jgi:hypothetical protein
LGHHPPSGAREREKYLLVSLLLDGRAEDRTQGLLETYLALVKRSVSCFLLRSFRPKWAVVAAAGSRHLKTILVVISLEAKGYELAPKGNRYVLILNDLIIIVIVDYRNQCLAAQVFSIILIAREGLVE